MVDLDSLLLKFKEQRIAYATALPFPHLVIDNFCDPSRLREMMLLIPPRSGDDWKQFQNRKRSLSDVKTLPAPLRDFLAWFNGHDFLQWLRLVSGIPDLTADGQYSGAGIHATPRGGKLGVHVDFNQLTDGRYRRLNTFLFLNEDWRDEWGGHLELWNVDCKSCVKRIAPLFNRFVMFGSTESSYHGHPKPLKCPQGDERLSFAWYYFSRSKPDDFKERHSTLYVR